MFATYRVVFAIPELILNGFISECGTPILHHHHKINQDIILQQDLLISNQAKLSTKDLPWLVGEPSSQKSRFAFWLRVINRTRSLPWILINSFPKEDNNKITILPSLLSNHQLQTFHVGPLMLSINDKKILKNNNINGSSNKKEHDKNIIQWLEKQEPGTVIYISFGTWVGPIAKEKITELAMALEETKRPFVWVLKDEKQWREGLPEGYLDRNAKNGKVVAWAPQEEVLKFQAVGCYLTHCGWNSTMEAIRHEKRLLCYPISGDQFVNCNYIVGVWGIGIKLEGLERGVILDGIEKIMVGREAEMIQKKVSEMKARVMGDQEICATASNLESFVEVVREANCC
ncbi:UDP-glucuronosyl/UDP-glucosyltransferase protein [Dioscorea alata]|uniref:UDP-glucuronosyl/UDP-glucosyltransferase protein n=1 Tax=Dioscorea alata TaxID=55571 RepID=A0ACB7WP59_DIOAL|nr:UDP-glucuronosyl/UDP-glucosyltransferase protein [Dioscorea alata]